MSDASTALVSGDFKTKLSERIKDMLMDMIPEDKINGLIDAEIKAFFETPSESYVMTGEARDRSTDYWAANKSVNITVKATPFRALVWGECHKYLDSKIKEVFQSPEFGGHLTKIWANLPGADGSNFPLMHQELVGNLTERHEAMLKSMVLDMAASMFTSMFKEAVQASGQLASQQIQTALANIPPRY